MQRHKTLLLATSSLLLLFLLSLPEHRPHQPRPTQSRPTQARTTQSPPSRAPHGSCAQVVVGARLALARYNLTTSCPLLQRADCGEFDRLAERARPESVLGRSGGGCSDLDLPPAGAAASQEREHHQYLHDCLQYQVLISLVF